ncbi:hypothetical protein AB0M44_28010 [Streptosporangium subroseum]|uniref:hypothetical protein n=1 Tax=Streptosporangium subroseum TaxID=106412 RepID=UPI00342F2D56
MLPPLATVCVCTAICIRWAEKLGSIGKYTVSRLPSLLQMPSVSLAVHPASSSNRPTLAGS